MRYPGSGDLVLPLDDLSVLFSNRGEVMWSSAELGLVIRTVSDDGADVPLLDVLVGESSGWIYADATKRLT